MNERSHCLSVSLPLRSQRIPRLPEQSLSHLTRCRAREAQEPGIPRAIVTRVSSPLNPLVPVSRTPSADCPLTPPRVHLIWDNICQYYGIFDHLRLPCLRGEDNSVNELLDDRGVLSFRTRFRLVNHLFGHSFDLETRGHAGPHSARMKARLRYCSSSSVFFEPFFVDD